MIFPTQPAIHLQAVTLLLGHIKCQLDKYSYNQHLISSILQFLGTLATTARACAITSPPPPPYSDTPTHLSPSSTMLDDPLARPYSQGTLNSTMLTNLIIHTSIHRVRTRLAASTQWEWSETAFVGVTWTFTRWGYWKIRFVYYSTSHDTHVCDIIL